MSPNQAALTTVRQFQSETEAIREQPEPVAVRMTLFVLVGFLLIGVAFMFLTKLDRVVTSQGGKIVPVGQVNVFQALDTSLIKSIDVREGDQVRRASCWRHSIRPLRPPMPINCGCRSPAWRPRLCVTRPN